MIFTFEELQKRFGVSGIEARDWVHAGLAIFKTIYLPKAQRGLHYTVAIELPCQEEEEVWRTIEETRNATKAARRLRDM